MKKTYINPKLEVVKMKMNQYLMAGSPDGVNKELGSGDPLGREDEYDF